MSSNVYKYVDLFCGAGGLSLGFENKGFSNILSIDNNRQFCETYRTNFPLNPILESDISDLTVNELAHYINGEKIDVVVGGPPCQGFSIAGNIGRKFIDDPRNQLFKQFVRIVKLIKPKCVVMEIVERLYTHKKGETRKEIINAFEDLGYHIQCKVLNSADFGVPQNRRRVFFIGNLRNSKIIFPEKTHGLPRDLFNQKSNQYVSIKDAIDDLPELLSGESSSFINHEAMRHTCQMLKKMSYVKDGGTRFDVPKELRPQSGDVRKYIRYRSDEPAICVTGDMRKVFHYSQNRALTVRELARLQTFPDDFIFKGSKISQQQQVGNAVPPMLARSIADSIIQMLGHNDK